MAQAFQEHIFLQTDLAFNYVLEAIKELNNQGRLSVQHVQRAWLEESIQSDADQLGCRFTFGGARQRHPEKAFGQTASSIIRMVMLEAVQVQRGFWPKIGRNSSSRSLQFCTDFGAGSFTLTPHKAAAKRYWMKYDHLYPHFLIEEGVKRNQGHSTPFPSMMLIIRNNFTELIEITTSVNAKMLPEGGEVQFDSRVSVVCIVRQIREGDQDREFTAKLKQLMNEDEWYGGYNREGLDDETIGRLDTAFGGLTL